LVDMIEEEVVIDVQLHKVQLPMAKTKLKICKIS